MLQETLVVSDTLARLCNVLFRSSKLPLNCKVIEKGWFWAPIVMEGDTINFVNALSNRTHFRACGRFRLSSIHKLRE